MLCRLVDGLARAPKKDVASCDKPQVGACDLRSEDFLMGLPTSTPLVEVGVFPFMGNGNLPN